MKERTASDTNSSNLQAINPVSSLFLQSHRIWKATPDYLSAEETFDSYENALEIGFLDTTPNAKTYADILGVGERKDVYRFELQSASLFELSLHGFKANADLVLQNSARHTISNSSNLANASEFISTQLEPGIYYVVVFSPNQSNTNYQLSLSAEFITNDQAITTLEDSLRDPEYDQVGWQVTWRDTEGNLWVAPVAPQTGAFLLEQAIQVDTGVAPSDVNSGGTGNGPEWVYGEGGSRILYTKLLDPNPDRQFDRTNWYIAQARWNGSEWEAEFILDAEGEPVPGFIPFGSLNPGDEAPLIKYVGTDPITGESVASFWRELDDPNVGGQLPEGAGRWVQGEGERSVVRNINNQIYKYDVDTETLTQITFSDTKKKGSFFMWEAPEFDNELVLMAPEIEVVNSEPLTPEPTELGIYRQIEGEWRQTYTIDSPSPDLPYFHSPEPFTYNGSSYISFLAVDTQPDSERKNFEGAEVWIVGVDPNNPFARQLSDEQIIGRNDPESLITEAGAFIYYSELTSDKGRIIHRADTGLGLPEQSVSNSIETLSEPTVDREEDIDLVTFQSSSLDLATEPGNNRRNALNIAILDLNPITQNFADRVGTDDRRDFYRFELENPSKFQLSLAGLTANADVFIEDAAGNLIASSTNKANSPETISTNLDSGSYYLLVRSVGQRNTSYDLTLKAQFITNVVELDLGGRKVPDPEFDPIEFQVTWQDEVGRGTEAEKKRRLWVAPVDRQTGDILFDQAIQLDNNLAPNAPISSGNATGNGPEWVYAEGGSQILYTKQVEPFGPDGWRVGRAQKIDGEWVAAPLDPELKGGAPNGSKSANDPNPLFNYFFKEGDNRFMAWRELNNPDNGGIVPFPFTSGARWVPEERFFVSTTATEDVNQVVTFASDTETVTQLTFDTGVVKDKPQMWHAPEFNNELIFFAIESNAASPKRQDRLGIYRNIDGEWQRIHTIDPPSDLPIIDSPEHFVYNNKSYIVMATVPEQGQGSQLWLAGIDPEDNLYRQISNPEEETASTDPEPFITDEGAFIYYAKGGGSQIFRADTGLGAPIADAGDSSNIFPISADTTNFI